MSDDIKVVESPVDNTVEQPALDENKPCMPCMLPGILTAWNATRSACEHLDKPESKEKCRKEMDEMAKDIRSIGSAVDVIFQAIKRSDNPEDFIGAQIKTAQTYNAANSAAILQWADEEEKAGRVIPEKIMNVVKILRLEKGI